MLVNLRGIRESGTIFAAPTYLLIGAFAIMILTGIFHAVFSAGGSFGAVAPHSHRPHSVGLPNTWVRCCS